MKINEKNILNKTSYGDEQWKPIENYTKYYISNYGRVIRFYKESYHLLKPFYNSSKKYLIVHLCKNGKSKRHFIHRLVASAFVDNNKNKQYVHHIDCDAENNYYKNLMWVTMKEHISIHRCIRLLNKINNV